MDKKNRNQEGWIRTFSLSPPTLKNNTADAERLLEALKNEIGSANIVIDLSILKDLPHKLRHSSSKIRCILFKDHKSWVLTDISQAEENKKILGIAIDLGTSKVVMRLLDLSTNKAVAESAFNNPQICVGPDILTRIHFADNDNGLEKLNKLIIDVINQTATRMCHANGSSANDIYAVSVAGNTTMTHLFMGLSPRWIIREPYIPVINRPGIRRAINLGITVNPKARVFIFPNIGSYFGGDLISGVLYSGLNSSEEVAILVDVGTNAEVILGNNNWLIACAGAAGPALEGGVTKIGTMAGPGAIERISVNSDTLDIEFKTIENKAPMGICGSGVIDLAAALFQSGMIDVRGKFVPSMCGWRLKYKDGMLALIIVPSNKSATGEALVISQADIDSLVRSKAAMYTILETISLSVGVNLRDLSSFYVAGTFGSFINPVSAITIGMLPDLPIKTYKTIGNSSLEGASIALTSVKSLDEIDKIRNQITYLELNVNQEFMNRFSAAKFFPHTDTSLFPSVKIKS